MIARGDKFLAEVVLVVVELRRANGQLLSVTMDADANISSVIDDTGYNLGVDELDKDERRALKRLVDVD